MMRAWAASSHSVNDILGFRPPVPQPMSQTMPPDNHAMTSLGQNYNMNYYGMKPTTMSPMYLQS
jgi:hypothetical protein